MENKFLVGASGDGVLVLRTALLREPLSREDALNLAAWIVALTDPGGAKFAAALMAVTEGQTGEG